MTYNTRFLIRRDYEQVLLIENQSLKNPWIEKDFLNAMKHRSTFGMVAEDLDNIFGYVIYELHPNRFHILNLAVHPDKIRQGIGSLLVGRLITKLAGPTNNLSKRTRITLEVSDANLSAHLFFKSLGFKATAVVKEAFKDSADDAYHMEYVSDTSTNENISYQ